MPSPIKLRNELDSVLTMEISLEGDIEGPTVIEALRYHNHHRNHHRKLATLHCYRVRATGGSIKVIFTLPRCVFLSFSTSIRTTTLSKTPMVTSLPSGEGTTNV